MLKRITDFGTVDTRKLMDVYAESNAEMETNTSVQNLWNIYDKQLMRRRRVFGKAL